MGEADKVSNPGVCIIDYRIVCRLLYHSPSYSGNSGSSVIPFILSAKGNTHNSLK